MVSSMQQKKIIELEQKLQYEFKNKSLLLEALTHKTYAFESDSIMEYNERLEFLGDSILNYVIAEYLYKENTFLSEGELTRRRAFLVNNKVLSKKAEQLHLGKYLRLGKGERMQKGHMNPTNQANALEAIIGAIYLDSNIRRVRKIIYNIILNAKK